MLNKMNTKVCECCGQEIKDKSFDWSLMPVDTVVEFEYSSGRGLFLRCFSHVTEKGSPMFFCYGRSSCTQKDKLDTWVVPTKIIGFTNNPVRPWLGGKCPVHPRVKVKIWHKGGDTSIDEAGDLVWDWLDYNLDIIAYKIVDQEIPV